MNRDVTQAINHLDRYGYCFLEGRMPGKEAKRFAEACVALHADPSYDRYKTGDEHYQTLFGLLNLDDRSWAYAAHPETVAVAQHFLGPSCRVVEACSKPTWPGAQEQPLHVDSAGHFHQVPDVPWMINSIWMLTDFTIENGATGVVPMSHRSRLKRPPDDLITDHDVVRPITGKAGSVIMWHGGLFHMARGNRSEELRVGLNIAYYPKWFNNWIEGGHQPVWPKTYERMPDNMKALCAGKRGTTRKSVYEV